MLVELSIRNYAVIDRLTVRLGAGFNVLTGETGAGKSILLDALGLLLGDKADPGAIRAGAEQAYVEGIFEPGSGVSAALSELLEIDVAEEGLILSREVNALGRSTGRINGRAVPQRRLAEVGMLLVDVHGQSEHLSLLRSAEHVNLLDRYAGLNDVRARYASAVRSLNRTTRELQSLLEEQAGIAGRRELLGFQAAEISAARLEPGEDEALAAERTVRVNALRIHELVAEVQAVLEGDGESVPGAVEMAGRAAQELASLERIDAAAAGFRESAEGAALQMEELVRDLRRYAEGVEFDQQRLVEIEERLDLISSLKRKYGSTIPEILQFEDTANAELQRLEGHGMSVSALRAQWDDLREQAAVLAGELAAGRRRAARDLVQAVEEQLTDLGMAGAQLAIRFGLSPAADGLAVTPAHPPAACVIGSASDTQAEPVAGPLRYGLTGVDAVEFLIAANPGEPLRPLATVASGGETSRLMLAIRSVLSSADGVPTLVFDEIDAGIGGRVGEAVGRRLWTLGHRHQVIAVTHLPQIAAYGDRHLSVRKVVSGGRTVTSVVELGSSDRVAELSSMLGSDTPVTRQKAAELLAETGKAPARGKA
ncbi:MAG TPA: DNA repair protein RecN [Actinomycetota bacterium]|nr:DNA repair protein RecN [Actinomycetota bacterium]